MKMRNLSEAAKAALEAANFEDGAVLLTGQLETKIYKEVNAVLEELGGSWNRKERKHLFPVSTDWQTLLASVVDTGQVALAKDSGFYPTPEHIVEMMIDAADFKAGETFLEPNGGRGNILKAVRTLSEQNCLDLRIFACELNPRFVGELRGDDFKVAFGDFLSFDAVEKADKILMNPPFEANGDIKHALHAFKHLKPGGKMIVITRAGVDEGRTRWHDDWQNLCSHFRTVAHDLPSATFKATGTLIETKIHVFQKSTAPYK